MGLNLCATMLPSRAATCMYQEDTQCWFVGSTLSKACTETKNAQVYRAQQLSTLWQNNAVTLILCNCIFNRRTSRHLSRKQCGWQLACCYNVRMRERNSSNDTGAGVVKYRVWWVVGVRSQSATLGVWSMAVVTGTVGLAFIKERLPNANKQHKNSSTQG